MPLDQRVDHFLTGDLTMDPLPGQLLCLPGDRDSLDSAAGIRDSFGGAAFYGFRGHSDPSVLLFIIS